MTHSDPNSPTLIAGNEGLPECRNCRHWGEMGLCRVQSGVRKIGDMSWAQTVTTNHDDSCRRFSAQSTGEPV